MTRPTLFNPILQKRRERNIDPAKEPWILGIGCSHNGSACLLHGDKIVVAVQEERLLRFKRADLRGARPSLAIQYCLDYAKITPADLSAVAVSAFDLDKADNDVTLNPQLRVMHHSLQVIKAPHHLAHAVAAFATSGFPEAAVLIVDGNGSPWRCMQPQEIEAVLPAQQRRFAVDDPNVCEIISMYSASAEGMVPLEKHIASVNVPSKTGMKRFFSIGRLFENVGGQIFGEGLDGAGKVMGLAPYGRATIPTSEFFDIVDGEFFFRDDVPNRFTHNDRWPDRQYEYSDLSASVQSALEDALMSLVRRLRAQSQSTRLCYAGGVALNSVANERLVRDGGFDEVFIMPASEDSGVAIGAAYFALWQLTGRQVGRKLTSDSVGRIYSNDEITTAAKVFPGIVTRRSKDVIGETAEMLAEGRIVGWFQGGSELGPRALGQRSILCDPRRPGMKDILNARVKYRESFRPYAPVVPLERVSEWFDTEPGREESPFMLRVMPFRVDKQHLVPSVVHVDGTGRVQTVTREANGRLYELVKRFGEITGVPILLNTSYNIAGEPIVETMRDALCCFFFSNIDVCSLEDHIVEKKPDFSSPLDFIIELAAEWVSEEFPVLESGLDPTEVERIGKRATMLSFAEGRLPDMINLALYLKKRHARITVNTPWGRAMHGVGGEFLEILRLIDGTRTGMDILEILKRRGAPYGHAELLNLLAKLAVGSAIRFSTARDMSSTMRAEGEVVAMVEA
jgi:carbamoyltransferase